MPDTAAIADALHQLARERALATRTPSSEHYFEGAIAYAIAQLQPPAAKPAANLIEEQRR